MIRYSTWGIYLLLVAQGTALIREGAPISFLTKTCEHEKAL